MTVSKEIKAQVEMKIEECLMLARTRFGRNFAFPSIAYNVKGKVAGWANYRENSIRLNPTLLMENLHDFIERTVVHELGHLVTWELHCDNHSFKNRWTGRVEHHGRHWKEVMTVLGGPTSRCHSYDVSKSVGRKVEQYVWSCSGCGELMSVSRAKHNRMLRGGYHHKCSHGVRGSIDFVMNVGRNTKSGAVAQVQAAMVQEVKSVEKPVQKKTRKGGTSNIGQAREYARANPGVDSSTLRNWVEMVLGVSSHGARGIWSKLKKEGLV